jgi:uncharacterized membrane protein YdjX (TVP38/TMEM64 family)
MGMPIEPPAIPQPVTDVEPAPPPAKPAHPIRQFFRQIGPAGPVALIATCMPLAGAAVLAATAPKVIHWVHAHGFVGGLSFVVAFALFAGFALVPTYANSILGGWIYKFPTGFPVVMTGVAGAALISYTLAHRIIGHRVSNVIHEHPRWEVVRDALIGGSTMKIIGIITLLRLSPILPFETTNVLLASCEVRLFPFMIGTILGVAPRTAAIVFVASRAHKLELGSPGHRWLAVLGIVTSFIVVVLIAIISKHALDRATRPKQ